MVVLEIFDDNHPIFEVLGGVITSEWNTVSEKVQLARSFSFFRMIDGVDAYTPVGR